MFSAFNPSKCTHLEQWAADCAASGEQSWTSCQSRDSNPQPWVTSGFKSNALSIRPTTAKLEKCEFHTTSVTFLGYIISQEGVAMDENKVRAVLDWPLPFNIKELQRFLGFANFYRRFIRGFSSITAPLTDMTKKGLHRLQWTTVAHRAFDQLKHQFTTAPILHHPDPNSPFVVEVDASNIGIGVILTQRQGVPAKLYPFAYYSWKLTPTERNYDVGDRELLAIKAALEEWRHWLEGALRLSRY